MTDHSLATRAVRGLIVAGFVFAVAAATTHAATFQPKTPPLSTPWTARVSRAAPHPEYPRPQLVRHEWRSLNGQWDFGAAEDGQRPPFGSALPEKILVPFPTQSALSGIQRYVEQSWYRRTFRVPRAWRGRHVMLNFGAVSYAATVYVNGRRIGAHAGDYDKFSFDITKALHPGRANQLVVGVYDPIAAGGQPIGKQFFTSVSVLFTASTGIWQSVWIEPVSAAHITDLQQTPDLPHNRLLVRPRVSGSGTVILRARANGRIVATARGSSAATIALRIPRPRLWSPEHPFLYGLDAKLRRHGKVVDRVRSYFGMRSIGLAKVGGVTRMVLNGKFVAQVGPLDQGFWPDGIYTAPTDAALRFDIEAEKRLGFNMVRKHVKVEPDRWYYWADRLGILVWQDMPNMPIYRPPTAIDKARFRSELATMIDQHRSHPSIVTWVPFNEGWGQFDVGAITRAVKHQDPSRLVDGQSGSANCCLATEPPNTDIRDSHLYVGPFAPHPDAKRASAIGEVGLPAGRSPGHEWPGSNVQLTANPIREGGAGQMRRQYDALGQQLRTPGLSAVVLTELTDVETEFGGLLTYDRRVYKQPVALVRRLNRGLIAASQRTKNLRPQPGAIPAGTTHLWSLDGPAAGDSVGGLDLSLRDGPSFGPSPRGGALLLDGSGQRAVAAGPAVKTTGSFTVSAWLRQDDPTQNAAAVSQDDTAAPGFALGIEARDVRPDLGPGYRVYGLPAPDPARPPWRWDFSVPLADPTAPACQMAPCDGHVNTGYGEDGTRPATGTWHQVTAVVAREDSAMSLYIDGRPVDTRSVGNVWDAVGPLVIGAARAESPGHGFHGAVDQVRTYARALDAAQAWRLFAAERKPGKTQ